MVKELTDAAFDAVIADHRPVLVDFWAPWCGPCRMVGPLIEELSEDYEGKAVICKINVDSYSNIAVSYGISAIPALLIFKDGKLVEKSVGARPKEQIAALLEKHL